MRWRRRSPPPESLAPLPRARQTLVASRGEGDEQMFEQLDRDNLDPPVTRSCISHVHSPGCRQPESDPNASSSVATEGHVRQALREHVLAQFGRPSDVLDEFWVPLSNERADVVVVATTMAGYEIKTDRDTLKRLPRQIGAYGRVFDECTVVVAERHLVGVLDLVPDWWGVATYLRDPRPLSFLEVRVGTANGAVDPETLVRLLWRVEVRAALAALGAEIDPRASRVSMWRHLVELVDLGRLKSIVRAALLGRDSQLARLPTRRFCRAVVSP